MRWKPAVAVGSVFLLLLILTRYTSADAPGEAPPPVQHTSADAPGEAPPPVQHTSANAPQEAPVQSVAAPLIFAPFASERLALCNGSGSGSAVAQLPVDWLPECPPMPQQVDDSDPAVQRKSSWVRDKYKRYTKRCEKNRGTMWLALSREGHDGVYNHVMDAFLRRRQPPTRERPIRVLDWGSGCGPTLRYLHDKFTPGAFYGLGIELTEEAVDHARATYQTPETRYCSGDGTQLQWLPDSSFDLVVSFAATDHVPSRYLRSTMSHLLRILKPGGMIWLGYFYVKSTLRLHQQCRPECGADRVQRFVVPENDWFSDRPMGSYHESNASSIIFIKPTEAEARL